MTSEGLEPYVIMSYPKYKALDQRAKKAEAPPPPPPPTPVESSSNSDIGKNVVLTYRTSQMKKLLHHIQEVSGSKEILNLPNLDELIKSALSTGRKKLPHEEQFFTFLFDNGMGAYVKNRSKINQYYQTDLPWYQV